MNKNQIGKEIKEKDDSSEDSILLLQPDNKLHVIMPSQLADIAKEFFSKPRTKPLLIFYDDGRNPARREFNRIGESVLGVGMIKEFEVKSGQENLIESRIQEIALLPQKAIELWLIYGHSRKADAWDLILLLAEKIIAETGKFVYIFARHANTVGLGYDQNSRTCVEYDEGAERCFSIWHDRAHFLMSDCGFDNSGYMVNLQLYGSYKLCKQFMLFRGMLYRGSDIKFDSFLEKIPEQHSFEVKHEDLDDNTVRYTFTEKCITPYHRDLFERTEVPLYKSFTFEVLKGDGYILDIKSEKY